MSAVLTTASLRSAVALLVTAAEAKAPILNAADGKLGDGDLGITVSEGWREASHRDLPPDVGMAFLALAKAFQAASPSSFGTLMATALMSAAGVCKGRTEVPWSETSALLGKARDAMMARGKGELGQKSVLDMVDALSTATAGLTEPKALADAALAAAARTLGLFRDRPNGLGRARMFAEKSIGLDDPGMLAAKVMIEALAA
ncbi:MAG: dihydroxyacetone kinase subunit L [Telmatospirillum sp.]|nr:dihydroxyacetone kinase subunit L [Telmatospirillum sp.]